MCERYEDHDFEVTDAVLVGGKVSARYHWWRLSLRCTRCGYTDTDYVSRPLADAERQPRPRKSRKPGLAYLKHLQGGE
jgi:predicted NBD/HSP70 family sugar kinase